MKKIIIAGAGHGGLTASYHLAEKGYDVTVLEFCQRENMGHDWHDAMDFSAFDGSGIPRPSEDMYSFGLPTGFTNPAQTIMLRIPFQEGKGIYMDRKVLVNYLVDEAEKNGVSFIFGAEVISAITEGERVIGVRYKKDGEDTIALCDLLIDAAGMHSNARKSLPLSCKIEKEMPPMDIFHVHRVYLENTTGETIDPPYTIELFHMNRPGIDWILTEEDKVDLLIGKFGTSGKLTQKEIDDAIAAFRKRYPFIGDKVLRGGKTAEIPLTRMLPLIVCDGYAAVGDSAGMTIPLNGSGINLSMKAGKILADTVIAAGEKPLTRDVLWQYEYEYFQKHGKDLVMIDILKNFFTCVTGEQVDFFLEKEILTSKELDFDGEEGIQITPEYIMHILSVSLPIIGLVPSIVKTMKFMPFIETVAKQMPKTYDEEKVDKWIKKYKAL
ncbi:MAG: NAD(P)/FAD-dependent oxidoreductase [Clostridia bacterium]|nr:NAD(P)/FAD-dependent oxidoreductase [Clostridia bacterium]